MIRQIFGNAQIYKSRMLNKKYAKRLKSLYTMMILSVLGIVVLFYFTVFVDAYPVAANVSKSSGSFLYPFASLSHKLGAGYAQQSRHIFSRIQGGIEGAFTDSNDASTGFGSIGTIEFQKQNHYQNQPYVANGYIGSRIPNLGQGFSYDDSSDGSSNHLNGWPLFNERYAGAFVSGFFNIQEKTNGTNFPELAANGYESIIAAIPQWTTLTLSVEVDGKTYSLDPSLKDEEQGDITNYSQELQLDRGNVVTQFTWLDKIDVKFTILAHREEIHLGLVLLDVVNGFENSVDIKIEDKLDFATAQRCQYVNSTANDDNEAILLLFQPHQLSHVNGAIYSKLSHGQGERTVKMGNNSVSQILQINIASNSSIEVSKHVGIVTSDIDPENLKTTDDVVNLAKSTVLTSLDKTDTQLLITHESLWTEILGSIDVEFVDDDLLTMASRASLYHLAANTRPNAQGVTAALAVGGLSSDSYGGMVFWDTDLWISGGLLPFLPDHAKSFVNYRLYTHSQAKKNVPEGYEGAAYPWTSGRYGNCTATGPCLDYEYHINVAVAYGAWNIYLSGSEDDTYLEEVVFPLVEDAAAFLSTYVAKYNETLDKYTTHNLTDPDEYANHVDNGAYTNAAIEELMKWASSICDHFDRNCTSFSSDIVDKGMYLPTAAPDDVTLEYSGMNSSIEVKQADVVMLSYPLDSTLLNEDDARSNLNYYAAKQVSFGPAMTFPMFSAVSSKLSLSGCSSVSYLLKSVEPYLRAPFAQYSEQNNDDFATNGGTHPAFPFLTAHGGILQAVLQLAGLKYDYYFDSSQSIKRLLRLDPVSTSCLGENGINIKGIKYLNQTIDFEFTSDKLILKHQGPLSAEHKQEDINFYLAERNELSENKKVHTLVSGDEFSIPLFKSQLNVPENIIECGNAIISNITAGTFGDISSMMNDGDNYTYWQANSSETAQILINIKEESNLKRGLINWGTRPAKSFSLSRIQSDISGELISRVEAFHQPTDFSNWTHTLVEKDVTISAPFNYTEFTSIQVADKYNITTFSIETDQVTKYLLLEFNGTLDDVTDSELGATINEISLFG
ncbi:cell wall acid trehalase Atc1p [[Candida] railenensis]|uniref:alpha,alpha-trehalase n=1 Tax=[Candida] railenensis TaxID=45579 RepID=A0A9P0QVQ2_9ASCO|nr:cell wall acid trehalase Atc1p [[Candida] railenensis]